MLKLKFSLAVELMRFKRSSAVLNDLFKKITEMRIKLKTEMTMTCLINPRELFIKASKTSGVYDAYHCCSTINAEFIDLPTIHQLMCQSIDYA